jgi:hypothetical protein
VEQSAPLGRTHSCLLGSNLESRTRSLLITVIQGWRSDAWWQGDRVKSSSPMPFLLSLLCHSSLAHAFNLLPLRLPVWSQCTTQPSHTLRAGAYPSVNGQCHNGFVHTAHSPPQKQSWTGTVHAGSRTPGPPDLTTQTHGQEGRDGSPGLLPLLRRCWGPFHSAFLGSQWLLQVPSSKAGPKARAQKFTLWLKWKCFHEDIINGEGKE